MGLLDMFSGGGGGWGSAVGGIVGGLLAKNGDPAKATSTQQLDPNVQAAVYKQLAGTGGLYDQQMAQGGLNDVQRAGMQQQLNVYNDPSYNTGFQQMRSLGSGLLGQPIAGNPFTNGSMADGSWRKGMSAQSQAPSLQSMGGGTGVGSYMPSNFNPSEAFKASTYTPPAPPPPQQAQQQYGGLLGQQPEPHTPGGSGGGAAPGASNWSSLGDAGQSQYYRDNPTMSDITQGLQGLFGETDLAKLQNQFDPGFAERQALIAQGLAPDLVDQIMLQKIGAQPVNTWRGQENGVAQGGGSVFSPGSFGRDPFGPGSMMDRATGGMGGHSIGG